MTRWAGQNPGSWTQVLRCQFWWPVGHAMLLPVPDARGRKGSWASLCPTWVWTASRNFSSWSEPFSLLSFSPTGVKLTHFFRSLNSQVTYAFPLRWISKGETWVGTWIPQKSTCSTCRQSDVCWPCQGTLALPGSEHFLPVGEAATTWTEGGAWRVGLKQHFGVSHLGLNLSSAASKMYDLSKSLNYSRPQFSHPQNGDAKSDY